MDDFNLFCVSVFVFVSVFDLVSVIVYVFLFFINFSGTCVTIGRWMKKFRQLVLISMIKVIVRQGDAGKEAKGFLYS